MAKLINNLSVCFFFLCLAAITPRLLAHLNEAAAPVPMADEVGMADDTGKESDAVTVGSDDVTPLNEAGKPEEQGSEVEEQGKSEEGGADDKEEKIGGEDKEKEKEERRRRG
ncbi:uncharacterized protein LOC123214991 [Mangifera indica]|uniref:uncharacterized protein LOC123214991 n=1 Tax=Mangifera indica TaxID=29780 RepID=UPI001CF98E56|nr:uncharacterized protein LOC123214991 [Mangifera indica]